MGTLVVLMATVEIPRLMRWLMPARPPMAVEWSTGEMRPDGMWRVARQVTIRERCETVIWRRSFLAQGRADFTLPASNSSTDALEAVAVGGRQGPGTFVDWWDYRPIPGLVGVRRVAASFADCPSGFSGTIELYVTPFDWRNLEIEP